MPPSDAAEDGVDDHHEPRRQRRFARRAFLGSGVGATLVAIAGCTGPGAQSPTGGEGGTGAAMTTAAGSPTGDGTAGEPEEELPEGVSEEEFVSGPVPEPYRMAESQGGDTRNPDSLQTKEAVQFQETEEAVEAGLITPGPSCGNCAEYIPDMNGDGFGACAKVEGYISPEDWCAIWQPLEEGS